MKTIQFTQFPYVVILFLLLSSFHFNLQANESFRTKNPDLGRWLHVHETIRVAIYSDSHQKNKNKNLKKICEKSRLMG